MRKTTSLLAAAALATLAFGATTGSAGVDAGIPDYAAGGAVSGNLTTKGSDTLLDLTNYWAEAFSVLHPGVNPSLEGKGSATAVPALVDGTALLGPMSREMKADEIQKFEKKWGYKPTAIRVCLDALAIYVSKDNPIQSITMQQADAVFSSTRKSGAPSDITTWGQLGLTGEWASLPISLYGRNSASGTYSYFKEHVLAKGDYKSTVKEQPGSAAVVHSVETDRGAIGYSGIGYRTPGVKAVPVVGKDGKPYEANDANVYATTYPISRALYIYVNRKPGEALVPLAREFFLFALSKQGQEIVGDKAGFVPLTAAMVQEERAKIQ